MKKLGYLIQLSSSFQPFMPMLLHDLEDEQAASDLSDACQPNSSGDDSIHQLRYTIDEMFHQVTHLVRSQMELLDAIEENPDDVDFAEAFWENNGVIKDKKKRIQDLLAKLWNRDPVYFRKVDKMLTDLLPDTPPPEESTTDQKDAQESTTDVSPQNDPPALGEDNASAAATAGVYL